MGRSLARLLAPVLQCTPERDDAGRPDRDSFRALLEAQLELNAFISRSADAFSYDDGIRFVRHGTVLEIVEVDAALRAAWARDGRKLARLNEYWFYRALDAFALSGMATQTIGRPANHAANQLAYIRALRTHLQLRHVYGITETVLGDAGEPVDVFQASLSLELMSAFFQRDFLEAFTRHLRVHGDWRVALRKLVEGGALEGLQNRCPLTWSDREAKIKNITGRTVTPASPLGDARMAAAILDFWSSDWAELSSQVQAQGAGLRPELLERPVLKFGPLLIQLPWHVGLQNNSTAAINKLRRLGQRRGQAREETQRIEAGLGQALETRGFAVVPNWTPDCNAHGNAGEVDLVCALDGFVLVIEVKSTFVRMSQKEAFQHASTTLRKAGGQLRRKLDAVTRELNGDCALAQALRLDPGGPATEVHGWIVDTSIECDHQRFAGFLKVSLEEVLIALRDDAQLLHDPDNLFLSDATRAPGGADEGASARTLYPQGFSARRFVQVIETQAVWEGI